jgi:chitinase
MQGNQWSYHLRPENIDYTAMTHLIHFSMGPNPDGTVNIEVNGLTAENSAAVIRSARAAGVKVLVCVGGWNSEQGFSRATAPANRERFINSLLDVVRTRGYDGVDLDWEPLSRQYVDQYASFIEEMRVAMRNLNPELLLTVACNSSPEMYARVAPLLDQINLMTYDYAGAWPGWFTWHNAAIYDGGARFTSNGAAPPSVHAEVEEFVAAGVPRSKIGIGIDFYGYVWNGGTGTRTGGVTAPRQDWKSPPWVKDNVPYYQIMSTHYKPDVYRWDSTAQAAYLSIDMPGSESDRFVSYDDETACRKKMEYVRQQKLGGVIIWELGGGWQPGASQPDRLLKAVGEARRTLR